jgi:hypothetical protein
MTNATAIRKTADSQDATRAKWVAPDKTKWAEMKFRWLRRLADEPQLKKDAGAYRLALVLCDEFFNRETGDCWVGTKKLCNRLGVKRRGLFKITEKLERLGYLSIANREGGGTNTRRMSMKWPAKSDRAQCPEEPASSVLQDTTVVSCSTQERCPTGHPNPFDRIPLKNPAEKHAPEVREETASGRIIHVRADDNQRLAEVPGWEELRCLYGGLKDRNIDRGVVPYRKLLAKQVKRRDILRAAECYIEDLRDTGRERFAKQLADWLVAEDGFDYWDQEAKYRSGRSLAPPRRPGESNNWDSF